MLNQDRTNNFSEACHKQIKLYFSVDQPCLWKFIKGLQKIQEEFDNSHESVVAGSNKRNKVPAYEANDNNILRKVFNYDRDNMLEYLRGLSHNYNMN